MRVAVAFDHRGVKLREAVLASVAAAGHIVVDLGADSDAVRIDYPDKALELGMAIRRGEVDRGILVCSTGIGMAITANKFKGVRAAVATDPYTAKMSKEHNNANILALGGRVLDEATAAKMV